MRLAHLVPTSRFALALAACAVVAVSTVACVEEPRRRPAAEATSVADIEQLKTQVERAINQGERDGSLNRKEASRLRDDLQDIVKRERAYRRDDRFTRAERDEIESALNKLRARVRREKRD